MSESERGQDHERLIRVICRVPGISTGLANRVIREVGTPPYDVDELTEVHSIGPLRARHITQIIAASMDVESEVDA